MVWQWLPFGPWATEVCLQRTPQEYLFSVSLHLFCVSWLPATLNITTLCEYYKLNWRWFKFHAENCSASNHNHFLYLKNSSRYNLFVPPPKHTHTHTHIPDRKADYLNQEAVSNNLKWPFFKVHGSSELLNFLWLPGSNFQGMVTTVATWNFTPVVKVKTGHWLQVLFNLRIKQPLSSKAWR